MSSGNESKNDREILTSPADSLFWSFDGPLISVYCRPTRRGIIPIGSAQINQETKQWDAFDQTHMNDLKTRSKFLGSCNTREEAKLLVENAFTEVVP